MLVVGILVSSLALLSDAAHMLTGAAAIGLSLMAINLAARPAKGAMTYGLKRVEILAAQFNGATLLVLGLLIVYEGISRLITPPDVQGTPVLVVALIGVVVNLAAAYTLSKANRTSLNVEGSFQHILTDLYAFIATAIAGVLIITTDFKEADGIAALFVSATMLRAAYSLLKASGRVFLEAAPVGLDPATITRDILAIDGVLEVDDFHVWEVTSNFPALSAHVLVHTDTDCHQARRTIETMLREHYDIAHTTIQTDHRADTLLTIDGT
jgi:cobalt-zinc-cadmium efflux system protein